MTIIYRNEVFNDLNEFMNYWDNRYPENGFDPVDIRHNGIKNVITDKETKAKIYEELQYL